MIVCSCNFLTEAEIRAALRKPGGADRPRDVYASLGCSRDCGGCEGSIASMIEEARLEKMCRVEDGPRKAAA